MYDWSVFEICRCCAPSSESSLELCSWKPLWNIAKEWKHLDKKYAWRHAFGSTLYSSFHLYDVFVVFVCYVDVIE